MAINLNGTGSGFNRSVINSNFQKIEDELNNNVLRRDGLSDNEDNVMNNDLDMNSNRILNLPSPESLYEPARLIDMNNLVGNINLAPDAADVTFKGTVDYTANNVQKALEVEAVLRENVGDNLNQLEQTVLANEDTIAALNTSTVKLQNEMAVVQQRSLNNTSDVASLTVTAASKDQDAVEGNIAIFDSLGNPVDSGFSAESLTASKSVERFETTLTTGQTVVDLGFLVEDAQVFITDSSDDDRLLTSSDYTYAGPTATELTLSRTYEEGATLVAYLLRSADGSPIVYDEGSLPSVLDYGAFDDTTGQINQSSFFQAAADDNPGRQIRVPAGKYRLSNKITTDAFWIIDAGVEFPNLPGVAPTFSYDYTQLGGRISVTNEVADGRSSLLYYGDPSLTVQKETGRGSSNAIVVGASSVGGAGVLGTSFTSGTDTQDQSTMGLKSVMVNDNENIGVTGWGQYVEVVKNANTNGITIGLEIGFANKGETSDWTPASEVTDFQYGITPNILLGSGIGESDDTDNSCAIMINSSEGVISTAKFRRGIVFEEGSCRTNEIIAASGGDEIAWYGKRDTDGSKLSYISGANVGSNNGRVAIGTRNSSADVFEEFNFAINRLTYSNDAEADLGSASLRWRNLYLVNSPSVTSDENQKYDIASLTENELAFALDVARHTKTFKWIGGDGAKHVSATAQKIWDLMLEHELDPSEYGFISSVDNVWSIKRDELNSLVNAAIVQKLDNL